MAEIQGKNHEIDLTNCFDVTKNQDPDASETPTVRGRDSFISTKMRQESSTLRPLRKKRRQLTGW